MFNDIHLNSIGYVLNSEEKTFSGKIAKNRFSISLIREIGLRQMTKKLQLLAQDWLAVKLLGNLPSAALRLTFTKCGLRK